MRRPPLGTASLQPLPAKFAAYLAGASRSGTIRAHPGSGGLPGALTGSLPAGRQTPASQSRHGRAAQAAAPGGKQLPALPDHLWRQLGLLQAAPKLAGLQNAVAPACESRRPGAEQQRQDAPAPPVPRLQLPSSLSPSAAAMPASTAQLRLVCGTALSTEPSIPVQQQEQQQQQQQQQSPEGRPAAQGHLPGKRAPPPAPPLPSGKQLAVTRACQVGGFPQGKSAPPQAPPCPLGRAPADGAVPGRLSCESAPQAPPPPPRLKPAPATLAAQGTERLPCQNCSVSCMLFDLCEATAL